MKILLLVPDLFTGKGGIQVFNNHLVKALLELGHSLSVVSTNDTECPINLQASPRLSFPASRFNNYLFSSSGKYKYLRKPLFVTHIFRQVFTFKPDLILCGHVNFSPLCMAVSKIFKIPYFTFTYGVDVLNLNGLKLSGFKRSQKIITISKYTKGVILEQINSYPEDKVLLLHPTFDAEKFKPEPMPEHLMDKQKIKRDDRILLTIARLSKSEKYKGYDKVIMAMKGIVKEVPKAKYILVGSGDDADRIKGLIEDNGLEDRAILAGFIPDEEIVNYYNLCDVFVMPSKGEGFGIVFLEALACGKPVIAGNKDGSVDAVMYGELGILVDPDNIDQIKEAIIKILKRDMPERLLDGEHLRKRVLEVYGFDKFKERVRILLEA